MPPLLQAVLAAVVLVAAYTDFRWRRIPNWLVLFGLLAGLSLNSVLFRWTGLQQSLLGIGLALLIYLPFYLLRAMGGGDVKLMMAVGALTGPGNWLIIFIITSLLGGVIALAMLLLYGRFRKTFANIATVLRRLAKLQPPHLATPELDVRSGHGMKLPHGVVIALGTFVFLVAWPGLR